MKFIIEKDVLKIGIKALGVIIENIDNETITDEFLEFRKNSINNLLDKYKDFNIKEDEILEGFNKLHDNANVTRRKNIPASENLIKSLIKNNDIPSINKVVDIYNIVSIDSKISLGAHDIDKIKGDVTLKFTKGDELYYPIGTEELKEVKKGEYAYIDSDNEIICRLEVRQVNKTKITTSTKNVFYIVQGNEKTSYDYLYEVANKIIDLTTLYCGGEGKIL
jgi:DNA/RNA-binding domain of Phe-tRNA-synthetase-like protein